MSIPLFYYAIAQVLSFVSHISQVVQPRIRLCMLRTRGRFCVYLFTHFPTNWTADFAARSPLSRCLQVSGWICLVSYRCTFYGGAPSTLAPPSLRYSSRAPTTSYGPYIPYPPSLGSLWRSPWCSTPHCRRRRKLLWLEVTRAFRA